jgi:malic enzyme
LHVDAKPNDLERYIYLIGLSDRNETLFYRAAMSGPARFIAILYDPTVADACLAFGHIYRRAVGTARATLQLPYLEPSLKRSGRQHYARKP